MMSSSSELSDTYSDDHPSTELTPPSVAQATSGKKRKAQTGSKIPAKRARTGNTRVTGEKDFIDSKPRSRPARSATQSKYSVDEGDTDEEVETPRKGTLKTKRKAVVEDKVKVEIEKSQNGETKATIKRKRKTKEEKEADAMPLTARTLGSKIFVGAHVSVAGGVQHAVPNSVHIG
jgi:hypothetical protein